MVSNTTSPGRAPAVVMSLLSGVSPSMVPERMGLSSPGLTSVWPPITTTPRALQARPTWSASASASDQSARPSGRQQVQRNHRGRAP